MMMPTLMHGPILEHRHPLPSCTLWATHPSRAHIPAIKTDVRRTWSEHTPVRVEAKSLYTVEAA